MGDLSASVRLKLDRAEQHLNKLRSLILAWGERETYETVQEDDPASNELVQCHRYVAKIGGPALPADQIATRLGDFLHNSRCVLDHLIWELSVNESGDPPPQPRRISFPAFDDRATYSGQGLHAVSSTVAAEVERLQPYHAGNDARSHPLWMLCELSNIDKHRTIHVVGYYAQAPDLKITDLPGVQIELRPPGPVENGTVLARVCIERQAVYVPVDMHFRVARGVAIPETPRTPLLHLGQSVDTIKKGVADAAERLRHHLP